MGKKKKRYEIFTDEEEADDMLKEVHPSDQRLRCQMEKKNRGGKMVTVIMGYEGLGIEDLAKKLKTSCGVGGSAKDGQIVLQGDVRKKAIELLKNWGFRNVK